MNDSTQDMETRLSDERSCRRRFLRVFGSQDGLDVLDELEKKFDVHLPVFQGSAGAFDPLDAMRRDAYREVFLYCRRKLELARLDEAGDEEHQNSLPSNQ